MATSEAAEFAAVLRELKDRSGRSYGALARLLHVSTSTLHRYCNGDAVPGDFAPVERLARLCGATADEQVALHRRWILADEARRRGRSAGAAPAATSPTAVAPAAQTVPVEAEAPVAALDARAVGEAQVPGEVRGAEPEAVGVTAAGAEAGATATAVHGRTGAESGTDSGTRGETGTGTRGETGTGTRGETGTGTGTAAEPEPVVVGGPPAAGSAGSKARGAMARKRLRRRALVTGAAGLVAVVAAGVGAWAAWPGAKGDTVATIPAAGASAPPAGPGAPHRPTAAGAKPSGGASGSPSRGPSHAKASGSASASAASAPARGSTPRASSAAHAPVPDSGPPLAVNVQPYAFEDPCSQHYLVDSAPAKVPPPPEETDARGWVRALGGVASGEQYVTLTVQGTGGATVVLEALHVHVVNSGAPLPWTDYAMGVGCGGGVGVGSFAVDLDQGRPAPRAANGQADLPRKVSEGDPEVFHISADTRAHDVSWYLELDWSSGSRHGTLRLDDQGRPFRTSGSVGRPAYDYPLGGSAWQPAASGN